MSGLILAAWLFSVPLFTSKVFHVRHMYPSGSHALVDGSLEWVHFDPSNYISSSAWFVNWGDCMGWLAERIPFGVGLPRAHSKGRGAFEVVIPLWVPFLIAAVPTCMLWYRDRRRAPLGECKRCGYNLLGNVSGICPECGTPVQQRAENGLVRN